MKLSNYLSGICLLGVIVIGWHTTKRDLSVVIAPIETRYIDTTHISNCGFVDRSVRECDKHGDKLVKLVKYCNNKCK